MPFPAFGQPLNTPASPDDLTTQELSFQRFQAHYEHRFNVGGDWPLSIYDVAEAVTSGCDVVLQHERVQQLCDMQNPNGTWGDQNPQSTIVDTLQMLWMLRSMNLPIPNVDKIARSLIDVFYKSLLYKSDDLVAFELIFSQKLKALISFAQEDLLVYKNKSDIVKIIGQLLYYLMFQAPAEIQIHIGKFIGKGAWKLSLSRDTGLFFRVDQTASFVAEVIPLFSNLTDAEIQAIPNLVSERGGVGLSPAATAAIYRLVSKLTAEQFPRKQEVLEYLNIYIREAYSDYTYEGQLPYLPNLHPIDTSSYLWIFLPKMLSGEILEIISSADAELISTLKRVIDTIKITPNGVPWSQQQQLTDLDDTATAAALISLMRGVSNDIAPIDFSMFDHFQSIVGTFQCYQYEGDPSYGSLLHLIKFCELALLSNTISEVERIKIASMLKSALAQLKEFYIDGYGIDPLRMRYDKWHESRYYGGQRLLSIVSVLLYAPELVAEILVATLSEQKPDGSFGERQNGSVEETSYAILGLDSLRQNLRVLQQHITPEEQFRFQPLYDRIAQINLALKSTEQYFVPQAESEEFEMPPLWISKNMYSARHQILSAVASAQYVLQDPNNPSRQYPSRHTEMLKNMVQGPSAEKNILKVTGDVIRYVRELTGKDAKKFIDGEKLSSLWGAWLKITNNVYKQANTIMIAIDALAESAVNFEQMRLFLSDLDCLIDFDASETLMDRLNERLNSDDLKIKKLSFMDNIKYLVAWLVVENKKLLDTQNYDLWIDLTRENFRNHNLAQAENARLTVDEDSSEKALGEFRSSFDANASMSDIIHSYTSKYRNTVGMLPILFLSLPSSPDMSAELMINIQKLTEKLAYMLSLASQIVIEKENLNLAIFYYAIKKQLTIKGAAEALFESEKSAKLVADLQQEFNIEWGAYFKQAKEELQAFLKSLQNSISSPDLLIELTGYTTSLIAVADKIATPDLAYLVKELGIRPEFMSALQEVK